MSDDEALQRRLRAVERSLTDGDHDVDSLRAAGDQANRIDELAARLDEAEDRIAELEASTQALRGYVGNVRSVNEDVEQRADAALAAVERLEARIDDAGRSDAGSVDATDPPRSSVLGRDTRQPRDSSPDRQWADDRTEANGDTGGDSDAGKDGSDRDDGNAGGDGLVARIRRTFG
ncbi:hypothetical protein OB920_11915 [Halobacteria archaeon HArc-gm2]|nr:hypothetical protein [Halobacteria archaeon HArc-gm2]